MDAELKAFVAKRILTRDIARGGYHHLAQCPLERSIAAHFLNLPAQRSNLFVRFYVEGHLLYWTMDTIPLTVCVTIGRQRRGSIMELGIPIDREGWVISRDDVFRFIKLTVTLNQTQAEHRAQRERVVDINRDHHFSEKDLRSFWHLADRSYMKHFMSFNLMKDKFPTMVEL